MTKTRTSLTLDEDRERNIEKLKILFEEHKDPQADDLPMAKALDIAIETTLELHENFHEHGDDIPPSLTRKLSTEYVGVHYRTSTYPKPVERW